MKKLNKLCFICGDVNCDGIIINGEKICRKCEQKIVNTKVDDQKYDEYKDKIKIVIFNHLDDK